MPSSTIAIRLVMAANASDKKNSTISTRPSGSVANSCGIQMKVRPSLLEAKIVVWSRSAESGVPPRTASLNAGKAESASGSLASRATI